MRELNFGKSLIVYVVVNVILLMSVLYIKAFVSGKPIEETTFGLDGLIAVCVFFVLYRPFHEKYFGSIFKK